MEIFQQEKWERRRDLTNVLFRTTSAEDPPYASMKLITESMSKLPNGYDAESNSNSGFVILEMFFGEVWESLQQMTNFSYWMVRGCL